MIDLLVLLGFWAMILAPCMVAMNTNVHAAEESVEDKYGDLVQRRDA